MSGVVEIAGAEVRKHAKPQAAGSCVCGDDSTFETVHVYNAPPVGETRFDLNGSGPYRRVLRRCTRCGHIISVGTTIPPESYHAGYSAKTYGNGVAAIRAAFERIEALRPGESDNRGRISRVDRFARDWFGGSRLHRELLDIGAGLGVFIAGMQAHGWRCTGVDPDQHACEHLRTWLGADAYCATFEAFTGAGRFDVVTLNKVLEHVADPVAMLALLPGVMGSRGVAYIEVPDGEAALADGPHREEFFIEHLHAFSMASLGLTMQQAGLKPIECARLREPSGKYTLFAFACAAHGEPCGWDEQREGAD